jgi:lipoate-protein ligase A
VTCQRQSRNTTNQHDSSTRVFELLVQPRVDAAESLAVDDAWRKALTDPATGQRPLLRLYELARDVLSVGRFHSVSAAPASPSNLQMHRRHSGGRCVPFGEGFVGVSLILPHRSALVAEDPFALNPSQVLNRCVRGILTGLKSSGIPAFYPGRDWVTVERRIVGMISFDVCADGGMLFEAVLARARDFCVSGMPWSSLASQRGPQPPHLEPHEVTSLKREFGVEPSLAEIAAMLTRGYATEFGISFAESDSPLTSLEREIQARIEGRFESDRWLTSRCPNPSLTHHGMTQTLLGCLEAYYSLRPSNTLEEVLLAGDIIANPAAIEDLERRLKGCVAERTAIDATVSDVFSQPENFVLGLSEMASIAATICAGLPLRN